jgi:hypothetical protein
LVFPFGAALLSFEKRKGGVMPIKIIDTNEDGTVSEKLYEKVSERLERFRKDCPVSEGWGLTLTVTFPDKGRVLAEAVITDPEKRQVASGHSEKTRGASEFTDATVEWTSTSAIGRALGAAGYGTGEIATADEILMALKEKLESEKPGIRMKKADQSPAKTPAKNNKGNGSSKGGNGGPEIDPEILKIMKGMGLVPFNNPNITYAIEDDQLVIGGKAMTVGAKLSKVGFKWVPESKSFAKPIG